MYNITILEPKFQDGVLLTTQTMQTLSSHIYVWNHLTYGAYSDGILSGFLVSVVGKDIVIGSGIFKYGNHVFLLEQDVKIPYQPTNTLTYIKLSLISRENKFTEDTYSFRIALSEEKPTEDEIEICIYKLQGGARLRDLYDGFDDMITEFDTINLIHTSYAGIGMPTLHPQIVKRYATELLAIAPQNPLDQSFCIMALSGNGVLTADGIAAYIRLKADIHFEKVSNHRLYRELNNILMAEKSRVKVAQKKPVERRKVIVD